MQDSDRKNKVETDSVKCPSCGANMVFDPQIQMLTCVHCGTQKSTGKTLSAKELDLLSGFDNDKGWNEKETSVFHCQNCGADVVLNKGETAKSCPFCGTYYVEKTEQFKSLRPNGVIPFKFNNENAISYASAWAKKKFFAPTNFKKNIKTDNVNGVYIPCFTFDSKTTSRYRGRIGKRHTRIVGSGKNRRTQTYTVWKDISGTFCLDFDDVLITAGTKFEQPNLDKISPFFTNESREYKSEYLLGFMAYRYDTDIEKCWGKAKDRMDKDIRSGILNQYSYDTVDYLDFSVSHECVTYKYVMLPTYVGNYTYKNKLYNFYINGSTGKVAGKTPISFWRVFFTVLICIVFALLICGMVLFSK